MVAPRSSSQFVAAGTIDQQRTANLLTLAGSIAGGIQGDTEASLPGGIQAGTESSLAPNAGYDDIYMTARLGSLFSAICPLGGSGALAGSSAFAGAAWAGGADKQTIATAWQWGGLIGGVTGGIGDGAIASALAASAAGARISAVRALQLGIVRAGRELLGGGVGAIYGLTTDHTATSALHWATVVRVGSRDGNHFGGDAWWFKIARQVGLAHTPRPRGPPTKQPSSSREDEPLQQ